MPEAWRTVRVFISSTFRDMQAERDHLVRFVFPRLREGLLRRRIHLVDVDLRWGVTAEQDALGVCRGIIDECSRFICILGSRYGTMVRGQDRSVTAEEVHYRALDRTGDRGHCGFYFRSDEATATIPEIVAQEAGYVETDSVKAQKLEDLKQAVIDAGFEPRIYSAHWNPERRRLVGLEEFGERVYADLLESIVDEFGTERPPALDEFAEEDAAMETFVAERVERYVVGGRQSVFGDLTCFAGADGRPSILALTGQSGCGKSALLAKFSQDFPRTHPDDLVITHFVGASAGSTDLRRVLRRLCHALTYVVGENREIPQDINELVPRFGKLLKQVAQQQRVVLILDALNQLDATDNALSLYWLPRRLPAGVHVIISSLEHPVLEVLRRRGKQVREMVLQPLASEDARAIIRGFLQRYCKRMSEEQIAALLGKAEAGNPLYLLAGLEELRTLGVYEEISDRIRNLPEQVQPLFLWMIRRLEADPGFRDADDHLLGPALVHKFVSCLGVSRHGLWQRELAELLAPGDTPDALGNVAALIRLLRPYLMHRGELLDFYHIQLREAVQAKYLDEEHERLTAHRRLAEYFRRKADPAGDSTWSGGCARGLSELPYHQTEGQMWTELEATLTDLDFVEGKSRSGMVYDLIADYNRAECVWPGQEEKRREEEQSQARIARYVRELIAYSRDADHVSLPEPPRAVELAVESALAERRDGWTPVERLEGWRHFIANHVQWLGRDVPPAYQLAWNSAHSGPVVEAVEHRRPSNGVWLRLRNRASYAPRPVCLRVLEGHAGYVCAVALTPDGRRAASGSWDGTLRIWDLETGECVRVLEGQTRQTRGAHAVALAADGRKALAGTVNGVVVVWDLEAGECVRVLEGHAGSVDAVALTPDGQLAISGGHDGALRTWDTNTGECLRVLGNQRVCAVALTPDGRRAVSGGDDMTFRVWDVTEGKCLRVRKGHSCWVRGVALTPDGRMAVSASSDGTLRVWDVGTGKCLRVLKGHAFWVHAVALTPDGRRAVSGGDDRTVRVWDVPTGECLKVLQGHDDVVEAVALTADGRRALSGGRDNDLRLWDLEKGECLSVPGPPVYQVFTVALTGDGRRAVSGATDRRVRVWDAETGELLRLLKGHASSVRVVAVTADGRKAVSGSQDWTMRVWDLEMGKCLRVLRVRTKHVGGFDAIVLTPDGRRAVSGSADMALRQWDLETGKCLSVLESYTSVKRSVALTADGRRAVSGCGDCSLRMWDLERSECLGVLEGHEENVCAVALTPDGRRAVSGSFDGTVRVWDLQTGECLRSLEGHRWEVHVLAVTPDGGRVVSASNDRSARACDRDRALRVWDLGTGRCLRVLEGHARGILAMALTADGQTALSASGDETLRVWDLGTGEWLGIRTRHQTFPALAVSGAVAAAATRDCRIEFLELENLRPGASLTTAARLWLYGEGVSAGRWDASLTAPCPSCGRRIVVTESLLGQDLNCPLAGCGEPLRLNPFVCDPSDWLR